MKLDVILPYALDYTPEGKFVPHTGLPFTEAETQAYYDNLECSLVIEFTPDGNLNVDYVREDGVYIMAEEYEYADEVVTPEDFVRVQYEIAAILGITTTDM
jgi:hypothetical protein